MTPVITSTLLPTLPVQITQPPPISPPSTITIIMSTIIHRRQCTRIINSTRPGHNRVVIRHSIQVTLHAMATLLVTPISQAIMNKMTLLMTKKKIEVSVLTIPLGEITLNAISIITLYQAGTKGYEKFK
uniref:Uncharacterized protein n=1 Tax=Cacopsylla melanoneura TaxID=428564 RepID=A0A8D9E024_9HEMI